MQLPNHQKQLVDVDVLLNLVVDGIGTPLPIPPGTRLNSTVSVFNKNHPIVPVKEDIVTEMTFTINSNISIPVDVDVLLNLVVDGIGTPLMDT